MSNLTKLGAVVFGAITLAACGVDAPPQTRTDGQPDLSNTLLSYVGFGGILDEQIDKTWMVPFTEETGAQWALDSPTDYSKIELQVGSGTVSYDIVNGDQFFINPQCGKLFEHINVDQSAVLPEFRVTSDCGVADYVYGIGFYYDKAKFPDGGPQNCTDFFDTTRFPGKRAVWDYVAAGGVLECAAIASGADPKNPYPIDLDKAFAKLDSIKSSLTAFNSGSQVVDGMVNGDFPIVMATVRNYVDAANKGADFGVAGGFAGRGAGAFAVPLGAPNRDAAIAWLKFIMNRDRNREITAGAPPFVSVTGGDIPSDWSAAAKEVNVVGGPLAEVAWTVDQQWWAENYDTVSDRYTALLAG